MGLVTSKDAVETKHGGGVPTPGVPWKQRQWPASEQELRMVVTAGMNTLQGAVAQLTLTSNSQPADWEAKTQRS